MAYRNLNEYFAAIENLGYDVRTKLDKKSGLFQSYEIGQSGEFYDASVIGKQFIVDELRKSILISEIKPTQVLKNNHSLGRSI